MRAFDLDGLKLLRLNLDILAVRQFVAAPLVVLVDDAACFLVDHLLAQPVAGLAVDLVKACFLRLGRGRVERYGAGHEELRKTPPRKR